MRDLTQSEINVINGGNGNMIAFFSTLMFTEAYSPAAAFGMGSAIGILCGLPVTALTIPAMSMLALTSAVSSAAGIIALSLIPMGDQVN
jgi:hypothetical protein